MKKDAVGYIVLSYNESVDVNKGKFDENGEELPFRIVHVAHHIEVRFESLEDLADAITTIKKKRNYDFLLKRSEIKNVVRGKMTVLSCIVLDKNLYNTFIKSLDRSVYEKFKGSFVKSGDRNYKINSVDFVENAHLSTDDMVKDFNNAKRLKNKSGDVSIE